LVGSIGTPSLLVKSYTLQSTEKVVKEIDKISINVKILDGSRAYLTPSYCYEFDEVKAGIIDKLAAARQNAAQNLYTEVDILTKDKLPNWVNEQAVLKKVNGGKNLINQR